jgi:hypothetical protein
VPYTCVVDGGQRIIYCRVSGPATLDDFLNVRSELARNASLDESFGMVMDLRGTEASVLSSEDLRRLAFETSPVHAASKRAIVISDSAQYDLARMFQMRRELAGGSHDLHICSSLEEALAWIGAPDFVPPVL